MTDHYSDGTPILDLRFDASTQTWCVGFEIEPDEYVSGYGDDPTAAFNDLVKYLGGTPEAVT
jgi:hypothetical protein